MEGMFEIFLAWCRLKFEIHQSKSPPLFKQGEIWWCRIGMNVGDELFGKGDYYQRPVLVLKKFSRNTFLGIPLTLREKTGTYYFETNIRGVRRWLILSQARTFDSKRLRESLGELDENTLKKVREEFAKLICS
jgi:mRNA interferase MazF